MTRAAVLPYLPGDTDFQCCSAGSGGVTVVLMMYGGSMIRAGLSSQAMLFLFGMSES